MFSVPLCVKLIPLYFDIAPFFYPFTNVPIKWYQKILMSTYCGDNGFRKNSIEIFRENSRFEFKKKIYVLQPKYASEWIDWENGRSIHQNCIQRTLSRAKIDGENQWEWNMSKQNQMLCQCVLMVMACHIHSSSGSNVIQFKVTEDFWHSMKF